MSKDLSRRRFLAQSAGLAGASLGLGPSRSPAADGSPDEIGVGFIGLGDRGRHLLGAVSRAHAAGGRRAARVVALCDVSPRNLKRALEIPLPARPLGFTDARALLDRDDVDAVFIATPVHLHAEGAVAALAAGKHLYLEKPVGRDVAECNRVLEAARAAGRAGRVVQVGFQRRYNPRYRSAIALIHGGEAGRVLFLRAQWHATGNSARDKPWLFQREKSGDIVLEQACHQFDIFNWVLRAPPVRACGMGGINRYRGEPAGRTTLDHYGAVLEYPGEVRVHLSHVSFAIPDRRFSGIYELAFAERMGIDLGNGLAWTEAGETRQLPAGSGNDTQLAVEGFLECIASGRRPDAPIEVGYHATLAAILCRRAIEEGRVVTWNELESA